MYSPVYPPPPNGHLLDGLPPPPNAQLIPSPMGQFMPSPLGQFMPIGPGGMPPSLGALPSNAYPIPMSHLHQPSLPLPQPPPPATLPPLPIPPQPQQRPQQQPPPPSVAPPKRPRDGGQSEDANRSFVDPEEPFKWNCDQVRIRIRNWIDNGGMKVTEFQKAIGVNSNAYRNFMAQNGQYKGVNSSVYSAAYFFFRELEERGDKMPRKKAKATDNGAVPPSSSAKLPTTKPKGKSALTDFGAIRLDGEEKGEVKIYDTCDEIRKKINAYLATPGITQASFLKDIAAQVGEGINIQGKQLTDFRTKKGPDAGAASRVYYGSYVFFEKLRLKENKPKSKHRVEMEKIWRNGMDTIQYSSRGLLLHKSEFATQDKYGQFHIHKRI